MELTKRYIARFDIEMTSPLTLRSGEKSWVSDQLIYRDAFGLPSIPGTSITGVCSSLFKTEDSHADLFGSDGKDGKEEKGSRLIFSNAYLIGKDGKAVQHIEQYMAQKEVLEPLSNQIIERDRVRIDHKGVAVDKGKFDEEILPAGLRFRFEVALVGTAEDQPYWEQILTAFYSPIFVLGGGTRNGKGQFKILACRQRVFDLCQKEEYEAFTAVSSDLNTSFEGEHFQVEKVEHPLWKVFSLELKAKDFFLASSGFGVLRGEGDNKRAYDKTYKLEHCFNYDKGYPSLSEKAVVLIPATSIKGALSHRTAYHYNQLIGYFADQRLKKDEMKQITEAYEKDIASWKDELAQETQNKLSLIDLEGKTAKELRVLKEELRNCITDQDHRLKEGLKQLKQDFEKRLNRLKENINSKGSGDTNEAVKTLFGYAQDEDASRGAVIVQDIFLAQDDVEEKLFNHVKIDRFLGGAFNGALFNEITLSSDKTVRLKISVERKTLEQNPQISEAFQEALHDLQEGRLALGGSTMKGHGVFVKA